MEAVAVLVDSELICQWTSLVAGSSFPVSTSPGSYTVTVGGGGLMQVQDHHHHPPEPIGEVINKFSIWTHHVNRWWWRWWWTWSTWTLHKDQETQVDLAVVEQMEVLLILVDQLRWYSTCFTFTRK